MLTIDAEAKPKQTNITEDITRKWRLKRYQFISHSQSHKPQYCTSVDHLFITCCKKCYLNNYREKCRRCTLKAVSVQCFTNFYLQNNMANFTIQNSAFS